MMLRADCIVLSVFLTAVRIRESNVEEEELKTGSIVTISKCCCASAPSPYMRRGTQVRQSYSVGLKTKHIRTILSSIYFLFANSHLLLQEMLHMLPCVDMIRHVQILPQVKVLRPILLYATRFTSEDRMEDLWVFKHHWYDIMWEHDALFVVLTASQKALLLSALCLRLSISKRCVFEWFLHSLLGEST